MGNHGKNKWPGFLCVKKGGKKVGGNTGLKKRDVLRMRGGKGTSGLEKQK